MVPITVAVGSTNPCKVDAVRLSVASAFPEATVQVKAFSSPSGVSDQPMGDKETITGAGNRARAAATSFAESEGAPPDFAVGLEGGCGPDPADASL